MTTPLRRILFGKPLPTTAYHHERLGKAKALAVLSSDALSSVAYATEEILLVLVLAGTGALSLSVPIALAIAALLAIVGMSYYQTALILKTVLLYRRGHAREERVIIDVPYHLQR